MTPVKSGKGMDELPLRPPLIKSPSDTTIYSPGLRKECSNSDEISIIDKISNFVESIRIDGKKSSQRRFSTGLGESTLTRRDSRMVEHKNRPGISSGSPQEF